MTPLIKKTLFRIKKLGKPLKIDRQPERQAAAKTIKRVLFAASVTLVILGIIYSSKLPIRTSLNEGDIAVEDIYAPFDFEFEAGIDEEKTESYRRRAESDVRDIYSVDENVFKDAKAEAEKFFESLMACREQLSTASEEDKAGLIQRLQQDTDDKAGIDDIKLLLEVDGIPKLESNIIETLQTLYSYPIISQAMKKELLALNYDYIPIYNKHTKKVTNENLSDIYTGEAMLEKAKTFLAAYDIKDKKRDNAVFKLVSGWIRPDIALNAEETGNAKHAARTAVTPAYIISSRSKGEIIIRKGQRVTKKHITELDAINNVAAASDSSYQFWGITALVSLLMIIMYEYMRRFEYSVFLQGKLLLLISIVLIYAAASARIIVSSPLPSYFIPVAAVSMLLTLLVNGRVATVIAVAAAVIVALIAGIKFNIFLVFMLGGVFAICVIYRARSRSHIIRAGLYVGILNFMAICAIGAISGFEPAIYLRQGTWGIASGIASAAIVMIFLPVLEYLFKLTTDIKLLELADLNHPLMKEMVTKATGTYHHSIIVGNLAEAAADVIGANSLLCRIGAYYHDIGKIEKGEYYAENKQDLEDMHKGLSPSMSSLVITNHVKDGVELAEKHKLGNAIKDIIQQHHGSSLVTYFYHQALEKKRQGESVTEEAFRYDGPKPQTKESAIVMLADSVEAASRVLQNPTPQHLKELVQKIINNKFIDHQLDECNLTLKDINKIAESFVRILTGTYHSRIEYPDNTVKRHANNNKKRSKRSQA